MKVFILLVFGVFSLNALAGILPASRGGTGANLTPVAGGVISSSSSGFVVVPAGTSGQVLKSNGTSAPAFSSSILVPSGGTVVLSAGTTVANGAPLYIPTGSTLATPMSGAIESNGTNLYWTDSTGKRWNLQKTFP